MVKNPVRPRPTWQPTDDYDDDARWRDDQDGGERWRMYAACRDTDPALFFPTVVNRKKVTDANGVESFVDVPTDEEPAYPPPEVKAICERCPVMGRCLDKFIHEDEGIFGGMTGYQRRLLTKKEKRKRCIACQSTDVVISNNDKKEVCLACGNSWDVL